MSEFNNLISMLNDKNDIILSKQAKIDELQLEAINVNNEFYANGQKSMRKIMQGRVDELQARIDEALQMLEYNEYTDSALQAIDILKGGSSE